MFSFNEFTEIDEAKDEFHSAVKKLHTDGGLNADDMSRNTKDGTITLRRGFFYRHGKDSQSFADEVSKKLTDAGVHHTVVNHGEVDRPFKGGGSTKQNSHFHVTVKPKTMSEETLDELSQDTISSLARKRSIEANNQTNHAKRAEILKKVDKAKFRHADAPDKITKKSSPKLTSTTGDSKAKSQQWGFGSNKGYGQGHYMGDSVELEGDQLDEAINEVLSKDAEAGEWISDFVHSDDPKFAGKSKEKRKQMALAAYYAKQQNEEVESLDELSKKTLGSYVKAAAKDAEEAGRDQEHHGDKSDYARGEKRQNGVSKAITRLTKEEVLAEEEDDKIFKNPNAKIKGASFADASTAEHKKAIQYHRDEARRHASPGFQSPGARMSGVAFHSMRAKLHADHLNSRKIKEEVESLDELSKDTLQSYKDKTLKTLSKRIDSISNPNKEKSVRKVDAVPKVKGIFFDRKNRNAVSLAKDAEFDRIERGLTRATAKLKEEVELDEAAKFGMDDIAVGGTVIYKTLKGDHRISKVRTKGNGFALHLQDGSTIQNHAVRSTDASDWNHYKDLKEANISTAQMGHAGKTTIKHIDKPGVELRMAAHDVKQGVAGYRDRIALLKAAQAQGKLKEEIMNEANAPKGHTIEAYGTRGMKNIPWRKTFKHYDHLAKWADENDSVEVHGTRDLDQAKRGNLSPAMGEEVELSELNKSTLASYIAKSAKSAAGLATTAMHHKHDSDKWNDIAQKKKVEGDKSGAKQATKSSNQFDKYSFDATQKQVKRLNGVDSAAQRLSKEETDTSKEPFDYAEWKKSSVKPRKPMGFKDALALNAQQKKVDAERKLKKEEIEQVEEGRFLKPKTEKPPKSTSTMSLNQLLKNKKENPGQSPFKTQDDKVKKYLGEVEETLDEGLGDTIKRGIKSVKRGMQGWDKNAVGPNGEKLGEPKAVVDRVKSRTDDELKSIKDTFTDPKNTFVTRNTSFDNPTKHSPAGLQKRVLDREMKKRGLTSEETLSEGAKHVINVTVSDPNHSAVSKRKETVQRQVNVVAKDRNSAIDTAINFYRKQGLKVHDHAYVGLKESTVPDRMKGKQKPYVSGDGKGGYEVLGNTGQTKATFNRATHGKDAHAAAQKHLKSKYNEYMNEETLDEASHAEAFKSETDSMKPGTKKYVGRKDNKEVHAKKDEQGNVKFYHKDGIKGQLKSVQEETIDEAQGMTPQQNMDFSRMMHGAMSRDEYNKKWKKGKYAPVNGKNKLDPTGVYHNLIKTVKEETMKTYNQFMQTIAEAAEVDDGEGEKKIAARADKKVGKDGRKYPSGKIKFNDGDEDGSRISEEIDLEDFTLEQVIEFMGSDEFLTLDEDNQDVVNNYISDTIELMSEDQLDEVEGKVYQHKGTYGTSYDANDDTKKKPAPTVSRGRGRPKKGSDETGEVKKFDFSQFTKKIAVPKFKGIVTTHKI